MIENQIIAWTLLSFFSALVTYAILTEGKSKFLLVITSFFSIFIGMGTSYIWLQITKGLEAYSWSLFVLPLLISCIATILLLSYYKAQHNKTAFPRVPTFSYSRVSSMISLVVILAMALLLASASFPSGAPAPAISMLGSTGTHILSEDDVADTSECIECIQSNDILIQKSVLSATSFRDNPKVGEYMNFKIDFPQSYSNLVPTVKYYVKDMNDKLISISNIISTITTSGVEGQIYCDKAGIYTITAILYDSAMSTETPMASNTLSYTVYSDSETTGALSPADTFSLYMIVFFMVILFCIVAIASYKWVTK